MKRRLILFGLIIYHVFSLISASAEDQRILEIRRIYNDISAIIKREAAGESVGANTHTVIYQNIMPGTGYQNRKIGFFHEDEQDLKGHPGDLIQILRKITVDYNISAVRFHSEYLFGREGQLLFYYTKQEGPSAEERRFYFYNGELIRTKIDPPSSAPSDLETAAEIRERAERYRELFGFLLEYQLLE
jgi:hypothetical protein